jgi:hypothetical protein
MCVVHIHKKEIRDADIIRGRGPANVNRVSHQKMLNRKDRLRKKYNYKALKGNNAKRQVQIKLLQSIHRRGGRVLEKVANMSGVYYELPEKEALSILSCKLREQRKADAGGDNMSISSNTTTSNGSFAVVMEMVDGLMKELEFDDHNDVDADEPVVVDFNGGSFALVMEMVDGIMEEFEFDFDDHDDDDDDGNEPIVIDFNGIVPV